MSGGLVAVEIGLRAGDTYEDGAVCPMCGLAVWVMGRVPRTSPPEYALACRGAWISEPRCPVRRPLPECVVIVEDVP